MKYRKYLCDRMCFAPPAPTPAGDSAGQGRSDGVTSVCEADSEARRTDQAIGQRRARPPDGTGHRSPGAAAALPSRCEPS